MSSREKNLAKNTLIITVSRISTQLINFLLLPLYTSLLSTEEYGVVDLINTYVAFLTPIVTLQLENALFRFLIDIRKKEEKEKEYISTVFFSIMGQILIGGLLFVFISNFISNEYKYYLALNIVAHVLSATLLQISRGLGDNESYAIGNAIISISMIILNIIFIVHNGLGAEGLLLSAILSNLLCSIFIFFRKRVHKYLSISMLSIDKYKLLLKYSLPLIPNSLSWWIINASDRTIIGTFLGIASNGIYAAANKFSGVYITFYNIFNIAWTESAAIAIDDEDRDTFFNTTINLMLKLFASICLGIISVIPFIFPYLINEKFDGSYYQIPILMLGSLTNVCIGLISVVYIAKKETRKIANTSIFAGIINIVINFLLIEHIGLYAASLSTLIAFMTLLIVRYIDVQKYINISISNKLLVSLLAVISLLLLTYYSRVLYWHIFGLIIVLVYVVAINISTIKQLFFLLNTFKNNKLKK